VTTPHAPLPPPAAPSARRPPRPGPAREVARLVLLCTVAVLGIGTVRAKLFAAHQVARDKEDTYFLPPPEQVVALSLGYKAAVADALWAHVLVSQGLHTFERRRFDNLNRLYDAINELDPTWRTPYLMADALITFQAGTLPYEDVLKARAILERGVRELPNDAEIWLNLGQFVAFMAPATYLEDTRPEEAKRWREEGARMLARAAELGAGDQSSVTWQAIGGANILEEAGEREAAIRFHERALAVTDDEELRVYILKKLARLKGERALEEGMRRNAAFDQLRHADLPFVKRDTALLLGPALDPWACAGPGHDAQPSCASSWAEWGRRFDATPR
jgi:tetratricopeptide (TPR) repeat protein